MLIVGLSATAGPRRVSLSFLYRWMCPALVIGFAALIVAGGECGAYAAYGVAIAARFAFCLITQMYFARYAVQGTATPVQSYGLGWIFVHMGDLFGVFALVFVDAGMAAGAFSLDQVAAVSMALLVVSTMFVLNDGRSFSFGTEAAAALAGASGAAVADAAMVDAQVRGADGASDGCSGAARPHPALDEDASAPGAARSGASDADDLTARIRELAARGGLTPRRDRGVRPVGARTLGAVCARRARHLARNGRHPRQARLREAGGSQPPRAYRLGALRGRIGPRCFSAFGLWGRLGRGVRGGGLLPSVGRAVRLRFPFAFLLSCRWHEPAFVRSQAEPF